MCDEARGEEKRSEQADKRTSHLPQRGRRRAAKVGAKRKLPLGRHRHLTRGNTDQVSHYISTWACREGGYGRFASSIHWSGVEMTDEISHAYKTIMRLSQVKFASRLPDAASYTELSFKS